MSQFKRQELFKDINPYVKKYKQDGKIPPSYIPVQKRKKITTYMGRTSIKPIECKSFRPDRYILQLRVPSSRPVRWWLRTRALPSSTTSNA